MSYQYADTIETINDVLTEADANDSETVETIGRIVAAASSLIDRYTLRPENYFAGVGADAGTGEIWQLTVDASAMSAGGTFGITVTAAGLTGSPITLTPFIGYNEAGGNDDLVAAAIAAALAGNAAIAAFFTITRAANVITLAKKTAEAADPTIAIQVTAAGTGIPDFAAVQSAAPALNPPATVRRYRGQGQNYLQIGRHVPGTVSISTISNTLYYENEINGWLYAIDNAAVAAAGSPDLDDIGDYAFRNCRMFQMNALYLVSARWGFAETPSDIVHAAKLITQLFWDRGRGVIGTVSPTGFVIERDLPPPARLMLDGWKRRQFEIN